MTLLKKKFLKFTLFPSDTNTTLEARSLAQLHHNCAVSGSSESASSRHLRTPLSSSTVCFFSSGRGNQGKGERGVESSRKKRSTGGRGVEEEEEEYRRKRSGGGGGRGVEGG